MKVTQSFNAVRKDQILMTQQLVILIPQAETSYKVKGHIAKLVATFDFKMSAWHRVSLVAGASDCHAVKVGSFLGLCP